MIDRRGFLGVAVGVAVSARKLLDGPWTVTVGDAGPFPELADETACHFRVYGRRAGGSEELLADRWEKLHYDGSGGFHTMNNEWVLFGVGENFWVDRITWEMPNYRMVCDFGEVHIPLPTGGSIFVGSGDTCTIQWSAPVVEVR